MQSYRNEQFSDSSYHKDVRLVPRILPTMPELLSTWAYLIHDSEADRPGLSNMNHVCVRHAVKCRQRRLIQQI
jgi:hypothetical protein